MIKFCLYLAKILIFSVVSAYVIQSLSDYGLKNSDIQVFKHWNNIFKGKNDKELLILGSSRGVVSYDPNIFIKNTGLTSLNLSFDAAPYNLQKIKLETYLRNNRMPKVIIQNVDLAHFTQSNSIPNKFQFIPFMGEDYLRGKFKEVDPNFGKYYFLPLTKYNGSLNYLKLGLINLFNNNISTTNSYQAYSPKALPFKTDYHNLERLNILEKVPNGFSRYKPGLESLEHLLNELPAETSVFLIWAPEHFERLKYATQLRENVENHLEEITNKFPNVYFLNYSKDSISLNSNLYYDTFHLNKKGATLFSEKVSKDIYKMLN